MNEEYLVHDYVQHVERGAEAAVTHLTKYMQIIRWRSAGIVVTQIFCEKNVGRARCRCFIFDAHESQVSAWNDEENVIYI